MERVGLGADECNGIKLPPNIGRFQLSTLAVIITVQGNKDGRIPGSMVICIS